MRAVEILPQGAISPGIQGNPMGQRPKENKPPHDRRLPAPESRVRKRYAALAVRGFLLLAVALVYGQTVRHEFVNYDDDEYVYENPHVTGGLNSEAVVWALSCPGSGRCCGVRGRQNRHGCPA